MRYVRLILITNFIRLFKRKSFYIIYAITVLLIGLLITQLFAAAQKGIKIPIGMVDEDGSDFSKYMIESLQKNPLLSVIVLGRDEIERGIKDQEVEAVYVIAKGTQAKVNRGDVKKLLTMVYLDGNNFAIMLSDIVSGDVLDEICLKITANYFDQAMHQVDNSYVINEKNEAYVIGKSIELSDQENYYVEIDSMDSQMIKSYDPTEENILVKKMTLGILFVLIGFFGIYIGLENKIENTTMISLRLMASGAKFIHFQIAQFLTISLGVFLMSLPLGGLILLYGEGELIDLLIYVLFSLGISGFVFFTDSLFKRTSIYIMVAVSSMIGMGIMSGSFFSIDLSQPLLLFIAKICPTFYSMNVFFDKSHIREYIIYTGIYFAITFSIGMQLNYLKLRRQK